MLIKQGSGWIVTRSGFGQFVLTTIQAQRFFLLSYQRSRVTVIRPCPTVFMANLTNESYLFGTGTPCLKSSR